MKLSEYVRTKYELWRFFPLQWWSKFPSILDHNKGWRTEESEKEEEEEEEEEGEDKAVGNKWSYLRETTGDNMNGGGWGV